VLRATANSWVEVRQKSGRVLFSRTMKAGETWTVPAESDLLLDSGNAGALVLEVNGVPTKLPRPGVVHDVPLGADLR
jgi:cytoskeleton protein RodZ